MNNDTRSEAEWRLEENHGMTHERLTSSIRTFFPRRQALKTTEDKLLRFSYHFPLFLTVSVTDVSVTVVLWPELCWFTVFLSCCLTSTEARWPISDGDRVGRGRESERLDRGNRPKKTGETVDRRQNNGSVKAVSPRHCPATCALRNCSFNCCAGQSH